MNTAKSTIVNFLSLIVILAVIYLLVKPSSLGPSLIKETYKGFATLLHYSVA